MRKRFHILLIIPIILICISLVFLLVKRNQTLKPQFYKISFDEIFEKVGEVQLSSEVLLTGPVVGQAVQVRMLPNETIVILDQYGADVFLFSKDGKFIKKLGSKGEGPGEYRSPTRLQVDKSGNIYVFDASSYKIIVYDSVGEFIRSFLIRGYPSRLFSGSNKLYIQKFEPGDGNTIDVYDFRGEHLKSFSPLPKEYEEVLIHVSSAGGIVVDNGDNLYQILPTNFNIFKFSSEGKLVKKFGNVPKYYKGFEKGLRNIERRTLQRLIYEKTMIYDLFFLEPNLIIVQLINHDVNRTPIMYLEIYTTEGQHIGGNISVQNLIAFTYRDKVGFIVPSESENTNPKIALYSLKWNKRGNMQK